MKTELIDTELHNIIAHAKTTGFKSVPRRQLAIGCEIAGVGYLKGTERGITAEARFASSKGHFVRSISFGPMNFKEVGWNNEKVIEWQKQIVYDTFAALPIPVQLAFINDFGNLDTLLGQNMFALAKALIESLTLPEGLSSHRTQLATVKNSLIFALS
jgi:hypothetical protein